MSQAHTTERMAAVRGLAHTYDEGLDGVIALRGVDLDLSPGERMALMGRSGSGKTTLLNILAGLEVPTSGEAIIAGHDLPRMARREREGYRRRIVGYVWQQPEVGLLPGLTILQNVLVPQLSERGPRRERMDWSVRLLQGLRLDSRLDDHLHTLDPLETQRLALAVALANRPRLLLADEMTARLDWNAGRELLGDVTAILEELETAAIVVTHDARVEQYVHRVVAIRDGVALAAHQGPAFAGMRRL